MIARNCTIEDLRGALKAVNDRYKGNIRFKTLEPKGKRFSFTITVKTTKDPGYRRKTWGSKPGKIAAACWHVHGHFFEALFSIAPKAEVHSSGSLANPTARRWITKNEGNWQDRNIGSMMSPILWSQACDCGPLRPTSETKNMKVYSMSQDMIKKCPLYILAPEHYKADGSCLCFDKDEQERIKTERLNRRAKIDAAIARKKIIPVPQCKKCGSDILSCFTHDNSSALRAYRKAQKG